jgi:hypothetical protein
MGDPCGRSFQLIMYFIGILLFRVDVIGALDVNVFPNQIASGAYVSGSALEWY